MVILSDKDIEKYLENKSITIEPFVKKNLTPNGYDLTVDEVYIRKNNQTIKEGNAVIPALTWFAVSTRESIDMGSDLTGQLWLRSSYARKGIMATFGKVDAGFRGTLTLSCFNANDTPTEVSIGDRFCQIVFERLESIPSELYEKKSGSYQNQHGVTLQKIERV
ncbi:MAG: dCTP deaminase [Candidatus Thermoplasmatota archaeon]